MPSAIPAMRGKFGSTEYFVVTMPAKELTDKLVIPKELEEWDDMTIEERFQREVNYNRVKKHIAPYLAGDDDRFFGAFIVDIYNADGVDFEPVTSIVNGLPKLYANASKVFGFLNFQGDEVLVPLDGQHRLAALRFAITGKDEKGKDIPGMTANIDVATDHCTVILVRHDRSKARKIFNKVNRYAKSQSKADNLITDDDDIIAIISRQEVSDKIIHERLVNFSSNTLGKNDRYFTTLSTIYEATNIILNDQFGKIDTTSLPDKPKQKLYKDVAHDYWKAICEGVTLFSTAIHDPQESGDERRKEIRRDFVLGKPIVQLALIDAFVRLRQPDDDGSRLGSDTIIEKINNVDWSVDNPIWQHILMQEERVVTGKQAARFAARFLAYYLGLKMEQKQLDILEEQYKQLAGRNSNLPGRFSE